jgi:endonuclease YncB( thermonuclease family)
MVRSSGKQARRGRDAPRWFAWLRIIVVLVLVGGALFSYRACAIYFQRHAAGRQPVTLVRVADGDTIVVRGGGGQETRVRLIGIDTPELGTAASFRSALFAAELLEDARRIELEPDPVQPRDKYGRTLGWIWLITPAGEELLLQEELLRAGLAELYRKAQGSKYYLRLELAGVDGVRILLYFLDHAPPHIHARHAEFEFIVGIESLEVLYGDAPAGKKRRVLDWAAQHQAKLLEMWEKASAGEQPGTID